MDVFCMRGLGRASAREYDSRQFMLVHMERSSKSSRAGELLTDWTGVKVLKTKGR